MPDNDSRATEGTFTIHLNGGSKTLPYDVSSADYCAAVRELMNEEDMPDELRKAVWGVIKGWNIQRDAYEASEPANETHLETIMQLFQTALAKREVEALEVGQLIGAGKVFDNLWDNSYYALGEKAAQRIQKEMAYYFGEDWAHDMYDFILRDGESKPSCHPAAIKTLAEIDRLAPPNKEKGV